MGQLLISARTFSRQAYSLPQPELSLAERVHVAKLLTQVANSLNAQLRGPVYAQK